MLQYIRKIYSMASNFHCPPNTLIFGYNRLCILQRPVPRLGTPWSEFELPACTWPNTYSIQSSLTSTDIHLYRRAARKVLLDMLWHWCFYNIAVSNSYCIVRLIIQSAGMRSHPPLYSASACHWAGCPWNPIHIPAVIFVTRFDSFLLWKSTSVLPGLC